MVTFVEKLRTVQTFGGIDASSDRILLAAFEDHAAYNAYKSELIAEILRR